MFYAPCFWCNETHVTDADRCEAHRSASAMFAAPVAETNSAPDPLELTRWTNEQIDANPDAYAESVALRYGRY